MPRMLIIDNRWKQMNKPPMTALAWLIHPAKVYKGVAKDQESTLRTANSQLEHQ